MVDAWKEVSVDTIKNCFAKCGITEQTSKDEDNLVDEECTLTTNLQIQNATQQPKNI